MMETASNQIEPSVIRAAGGLIWRDSPRGREVAVIRRMRYGEEWTLPKGKLQDGESWSEAALREVNEETGCEVTLGSLAGCVCYVVDQRPKLVLFWNMELLRAGEPRDSGEVKELRWLTITEALRDLKHTEEKRILREVAGKPPDLPTFRARFKSWGKRFWLSSSAQRLMEALPCYSVELNHIIQQANENKVPDRSWEVSALALLDEAKQALNQGEEDRGWHCFLGAQRMELRGLHPLNPTALQLRGETLRDEALDKLKSWRKERVEKLSSSPAGDQRPMSLEEISEIAEILHRHFENEAIKRRAQRRHLRQLIILALSLAASWLVLLAFSPGLMNDKANIGILRLTLAVMLFGLLGASLSGILSTFSDPSQAKIPQLLLSFRVTLARLVVGLLSAVAASVMLMSGFLRIGDLQPSTTVILLAALAAGFSERLVTSALKKASG